MPRTELSLQELLTPPDQWARYEELCQERPEVRVTRFLLASKGAQLAWLHSVGVCVDEALAQLVPPLPPERLRRIVAASEPEMFLWTGFADLSQFLVLFETHHQSPEEGRPRILDFGCGCGRLLRFLARAAQEWDVFGVDVHPDLADWCSRNLHSAQVLRNNIDPPLPMESGSFDLVYSLSVFSHLAEQRASRWLAELARVLRPGGVLIATTHGQRALEITRDSIVHQELLAMSGDDAKAVIRRLPEDGFVHRRLPASAVSAASAGEDYGNCFVHPDYVKRNWTAPNFELCELIPSGLRGWQDVLILRRLVDP